MRILFLNFFIFIYLFIYYLDVMDHLFFMFFLGFTIPKGWAIMLLTSSLHFNPNTYKNPLEFNPWRWKVQMNN